jgi:hypothetical protein
MLTLAKFCAHSLLFLTLLWSHGLLAQVTLQQTDFGTSRDTTIAYYRARGLTKYPPEAQVASQGWDFSDLTYRSTTFLNLYPPGSLLEDEAFPDMAYSVEAATDLYLFVRTTPDSVAQLGLAGNAQSLVGVPIDFSARYTPPLHMASLPASQGQQFWQQTGFDVKVAASYLFIDSARVKRTLRRGTHMQAAGDLILPNRAATPALLVVTADTTVDSLWVRQLGVWTNGAVLFGIPGEVRDTLYTYSWYASGQMSHLLQILTGPDSLVSSIQYLGYTGAVGRRAQLASSASIKLFPNPCYGTLHLEGALQPGSIAILTNVLGQTVARLPVQPGQPLYVRDLLPGTYSLQLQQPDGSLLPASRFQLLTPR